MNEKIKELAEQAVFDEIGKDYSLYFNLTKEKVEKFAELIMKECIQVVHNNTDDSVKVALAIETHFGID